MAGTSLITRRGTGGVAQTRIPLQRKGPQDVRPYFPYRSVIPVRELPGGLHIGHSDEFKDGRTFTIMSTREIVVPGRGTYWAGSEEGQTSASGSGNARLRPAAMGDKDIYLSTDGEFSASAFMGGMLTITGGLSTVAGHEFLIGGSSASVANSTDTSVIPNAAGSYITHITLAQPLPFALDVDTDWLIQSSVYECQSQSDGTSQTYTFTGIPLVRAEGSSSEEVAYWASTRGRTVGQLQSGITDVSHTDAALAWSVASGDVGKLVTATSNTVARLINRASDADYGADGFVPVQLFGNFAS